MRGRAAVLVVLCGFPCLAWADQSPPTPVQAVALQPAVWRAEISLPASVAAGQAAALAAERAGRVVAVLYESGQAVEAGAVLVRLDDGPEAAQLALDEAKLTEADDALAREKKLLTIAGASRAALEQAAADAAEANAQVTYDQAVLAQLRVVAPFAGRLGIRGISAGDYVAQGQVVARITQAEPLRVLFSLPQSQAGGVALGDSFSFSAPAVAGSLAGVITALSPEVDTQTNARDAEGVITDPTGALLPGMFGTVTLATGAGEDAFTVPPAALNDSALGPFLFVLDPAKLAPGENDFTLRTVYVTKLGDAGTKTYVATNGLRAGEKVLAIGGFKLTDGQNVSLQGQ